MFVSSAMDPDYELSDSVREEANKRREKEKCEQIEKARAKIHEDFQKEFEQREEQIIEIQNRITCLAKTLHVLRYVLVSNYYNKQETQQHLSEEELKLVDNQPRLHPAVKRLTSESELSNLDFSKRKTRRTQKFNQVLSIDMEEKLESNEDKKEPLAPIINSNLNVKQMDESVSVPRNRQMTKRRIIVGNISKWIPSDNTEDNSTHKWMVYIRGPPERPRIDDFIKKIVFHLHPSYQPHDVIDIAEHPFHLTRRGWGEFPMRCQLVFKNQLNKPVDVIHHLKLDKTYSGRQTLGNESIVELTLYDENAPLVDHQATNTESKITQDSPQTCIPKRETSKITKQLLVDDFSHSVTIKNEILDPSYMDVENIDILETSVPDERDVEKNEPVDVYYEHCPALSDHTYSMKVVRSY